MEDSSGLEGVLEQMDLKMLQDGYAHLTRNMSPEQRAEVEAPGPLHEDQFIRVRQQLYRQIARLESAAADAKHSDAEDRHSA